MSIPIYALPRNVRQRLERQEWKDSLTFYLLENKYFTDEEVEIVIEEFLWSNIDEGGELMEEDPVKWWRWYVREVVLDD